MKLKQITACLVAATFFGSNPVFAQTSKVSGDVIKIGVLTDLSSIYSDLAGPGAVIAAKMAIADFSKDGTVIGKKIELLNHCFSSATEEYKQGIANFIAERLDAHEKHQWQLRSILKKARA